MIDSTLIWIHFVRTVSIWCFRHCNKNCHNIFISFFSRWNEFGYKIKHSNKFKKIFSLQITVIFLTFLRMNCCSAEVLLKYWTKLKVKIIRYFLLTKKSTSFYNINVYHCSLMLQAGQTSWWILYHQPICAH